MNYLVKKMYKKFINKFFFNTNTFLSIVIILFFAIPIYFSEAVGRITSDYTFHVNLAEKIIETKALLVPHFLYHLLIIFTSLLIPQITLKFAGYYIVPLFCYLVLGIVISNNITEVTGKPKLYKHSIFIVIVTLSLMIVTPINFITWPNLYLGYIGINVYHNPTVTLVKPLSLLSFLYITKILSNEYKSSLSRTMNLKLFILTTLSLISKPSYYICLLPSLFLYLGYKLLSKNKRISWLGIMVGVLVPAVTILFWQYSITYGANQALQEKSSIVFAPFIVMNHLSSLAKSNFYYLNILQKFILSVTFPAFVYILYFKEARKDLRLNFAWLNFAVSAFYTYFLAEAGSRMFHGNFTWSGQICLFILFFCSTIFIISRFKTDNINIKCLICAFIFILHLISGLLFYGYPNSW
ncbi:hypothetical protein [Coleofasciculus sp. FACHB-501]|uniref:hypothetical protein n=1 Tax=Cyanophyceae TaxID=3028117 RepID=UPI0016847F85|nr:hypothetical protein [Coleofasciculus sp. FACHB-501]MBD1837177.1 hypothetical protein [Coleofasciculus sp. FACHB-501]